MGGALPRMKSKGFTNSSVFVRVRPRPIELGRVL